jgi:hypothetical protein
MVCLLSDHSGLHILSFRCVTIHIQEWFSVGLPSTVRDDIILTASSSELLHSITSRLSSEFAMTDLGDLSYFLGISVTRSTDGLHLSQWQYALDLLKHAGMAECHATTTPVDTSAKLSASDGLLVFDPSDNQSIVGTL